MSPEEFTSLKNKIQSSAMLTADEKQEWLFLLPRMSEEQIKEMDRILSIKLPPAQKVVPPSPPPEPKVEPKRKETEASKPVPPPVVVKPHPSLPPEALKIAVPPPVEPNIPPKPLSPELEKLKAVSLQDLQAVASLETFLANLLREMKDLANSGKTSRREVYRAFLESALHAAYLKTGLNLLAGRGDEGPLTHKQFEKLTDFLAMLKKM